MVRNFEFTYILGWSASRYDAFSTCKRKYYYQYYAKQEPEETQIKINTLKGLTSIPLEIGNVSHEVIKTLLERLKKTARPIERDRFLNYVGRKAADILAEKNFSEVYYKEKEAVDASTEIIPRVESALTNLIDSDRLPWLMEEAIAQKGEWIIEPGGFGECRIDGLKAYCKVDFLFPVGDIVHIFDWKTGKPHDEKHLRQMLGYANWAHFHLGTEYSNIRTTVAYLLPEYKERKIERNEFEFEEFADVIRSETEEMYGYCENIESNTPKPIGEFPKTDILKNCSWCNFRELCGRE